MTDDLPSDIDLKERKNIVRRELDKIFGGPKIKEALKKVRKLNKKVVDKKKHRRKIAASSKRRNRK